MLIKMTKHETKTKEKMKPNEKNIYLAAGAIILLAIGIFAYLQIQKNQPITDGASFIKTENSIDIEDGKPVVRVFSTTWCPHCIWAKPTVDKVLKEYSDKGLIKAYHWELDTGDNTVTEEIESEVPASEKETFKKYNPQGTIPTYAIGNYVRIGNAFEKQNNKKAEEAELRAIIERLINEAKTSQQNR